MKTEHFCGKCGMRFSDPNECLAHENAHVLEEEFERTVPKKFEPHSVVRRKSNGKVGDVSCVNVVVARDGGMSYEYCIGFDDMFHSISVPEDDLELVMTSEQVVEAYETMIPKVKEHGLSMEEFFEATASWYMD